MTTRADIEQAARLLRDADGVLVGAGAGMGVDSGLPDFRGDHGFWKAYPPLARLGIPFSEIANPASFRIHPELAWGFYGHRLRLYRETVPHQGFAVLRALARTLPRGAFVFTSNVDGQFQKAGFDEDRVVEWHGSIHFLQCTQPCGAAPWPAAQFQPEVDLDSCLLTSPLPRCPHCGALARPNILMFNDSDWQSGRTEAQYERLAAWRATVGKLVVVELGAGTDIPSVRRMGEAQQAPIIRINPRASAVQGGVGLALGAREALLRLGTALGIDETQQKRSSH